MSKELTPQIFSQFTIFIHDKFGIKVGLDKKSVLDIRLKRIMTKYIISDYEELLSKLSSGKDDKLRREFLSEITINKTDFFREINHFNFMKNKMDFILDKNRIIIKNNEIRVWSSACSTGEEPYTLAMVLKEIFGETIKIKILATDISEKALTAAIKGEYNRSDVELVQPYYVQKYFNLNGGIYEITDEIKECVTFRLFNLMENFPFANKFDIIFCRNVMIYFDADTQEKIVSKFYNVLNAGGMLFIGHSESLSYRDHRFKYVQPTIYMK